MSSNSNERRKPEVNQIARIVNSLFLDSDYRGKDWESVRVSLIDHLVKLLADREKTLTEKVDRIEVIDETGRAYIKGSIYGSPVKVELSLQDSNRTLKVFVESLSPTKSDGGENGVN